VEAEFVSRAVAAATALAGELHLRVDDAVVIHNSNKLALRLLPCGVFARVALVGQEVAALEVELALRLARTASPVAALEPRVEPRVYERDGFAVTLRTYYEVVAPDLDLPGAYADALQRLHTGMRSVEIATPHFLDRAADAERLVTHQDETPALTAQRWSAWGRGPVFVFNPQRIGRAPSSVRFDLSRAASLDERRRHGEAEDDLAGRGPGRSGPGRWRARPGLAACWPSS
jgi:hypothetical protein